MTDPSASQIDIDEDEAVVDYIAIPKTLDAQYELVDKEGSVRSTIITPSTQWTKRSQASLLAACKVRSLGGEDQAAEKRRAFDLLDALTKSGALQVSSAALHVVVAATHCFDSSVMDTVIQKNINPIEKAEQATLVAASIVHGRSPQEMVEADQLERLMNFSPRLQFLEGV